MELTLHLPCLSAGVSGGDSRVRSYLSALIRVVSSGVDGVVPQLSWTSMLN
jgi:hypothetical protein